MKSNTISLNLRRLRSTRGLSQQRLAENIGISRIAYRNIENGISMPKVSTLQDIAKALDVKLQDLVTPTVSISAIRFRAQKKMARREQIVVDVSRWLEDFNDLENRLNEKVAYRFSDLVNRFSAEKPGLERSISAASEARNVLGLTENEPIKDICGSLESNGIKVYPLRLASDAFFGLSVAASEGGPAIVVNVWERISVERWIFSAAHELGHLLLHLDAYDVTKTIEDKEQETEANAFASYFLMPNNAFISEWQDTYGLPFVDRVLKVKRIFGVSYRTVLYRLATTSDLGGEAWVRFQGNYSKRYGRTLQREDEPAALLADSFRATFPEIHGAHEPERLSEKDFVEDRLARLVRIAIERREISMDRGAEILRLNLKEMRDLVASWVE